MRALVLRAAGTNCDGETMRALELAGARPELHHLYRVAEDPSLLDRARIAVIPGGFSYGDYVAAGRILALELSHRLGGGLARFAARGGLVLGICNGFQVLVETGLLEDPDLPRASRGIALEANASGRFECRWTLLENQRCRSPWIQPGLRWPAPVAHGEGRFSVRDRAVLERLQRGGQVALRYVGASGGAASYPDCPNGSVDSIAGICDPTGRVLGLMPHPERNVAPEQHPAWTRSSGRTEGEGLDFFRRLVACAREVELSHVS